MLQDPARHSAPRRRVHDRNVRGRRAGREQPARSSTSALPSDASSRIMRGRWQHALTIVEAGAREPHAHRATATARLRFAPHAIVAGRDEHVRVGRFQWLRSNDIGRHHSRCRFGHFPAACAHDAPREQKACRDRHGKLVAIVQFVARRLGRRAYIDFDLKCSPELASLTSAITAPPGHAPARRCAERGADTLRSDHDGGISWLLSSGSSTRVRSRRKPSSASTALTASGRACRAAADRFWAARSSRISARPSLSAVEYWSEMLVYERHLTDFDVE